MQGPAWIALFRRIPPELHEVFALVLTTGVEILLSSIIRLERDFAVIRGRMSGSMDAGRIIIVPFDQINFLAINKKVTEPDAAAIFDKPIQPPVTAAVSCWL